MLRKVRIYRVRTSLQLLFAARWFTSRRPTTVVKRSKSLSALHYAQCCRNAVQLVVFVDTTLAGGLEHGVPTTERIDREGEQSIDHRSRIRILRIFFIRKI